MSWKTFVQFSNISAVTDPILLKKILAQNFFQNKIFLTKFFFRPKLFLDKNFFGPVSKLNTFDLSLVFLIYPTKGGECRGEALVANFIIF